ncbi:hypothetical protein [Nocardioides massiliensis]|uniref:DUF2207 domain-containing protein n=1 Tax=Nocardioides massiliensis TaxID=1325935 RepID=A0ABT9NJM6_9ACTN|nr:hypothetical protein [Nocardioides massiliensis]MDP9820618.1 hypothetical protein [Nocardioides massiliensis]
MGWVIALIVVAIILGVIGLVVEAVKWLLIIAAALFVIGLVRAFFAGRGSAKNTT